MCATGYHGIANFSEICILPLKLSTPFFLVNDKTQGPRKDFELKVPDFFTILFKHSLSSYEHPNYWIFALNGQRLTGW